MALALYRKYRPRSFSEVIGQDHVTEPLMQALRSGRLNHAYLFSGPRGCGKTSSARILARSLNCAEGPTPQPCGECDSCRALAPDGSGSIDVIEIDAASHGGVDDARELRERAFFAPAASRYKIYIIDEAHMVSSAGFNALLKLVEEPPDYVKFVFATTEPEKVLGTIKSRTHHYPFRLIPPGVLRPYLELLASSEGVKVEPQVFPLVVRAGGGSARDTLSVLDQLIAGSGSEGVTYARAVALLGVTDVTLIDDMVDALAAADGAAAFSTIDQVAEAGHDARRFAGDLLQRMRDLIILRQIPEAVEKGLLDAPGDELTRMRAQSGQIGEATLSRYADIVHNGLVEMRGAASPRLLLELVVARMLLPAVDDSTSALLQRLERLEQGSTTTGSAAHAAAPTAHSGQIAAPTATAAGSGQAAARQAAAQAASRTNDPPTPSPPTAPEIPAVAAVSALDNRAVATSSNPAGPGQAPAATRPSTPDSSTSLSASRADASDPPPDHDDPASTPATQLSEPRHGGATGHPSAQTSEPRQGGTTGHPATQTSDLGSDTSGHGPGSATRREPIAVIDVDDEWPEIRAVTLESRADTSNPSARAASVLPPAPAPSRSAVAASATSPMPAPRAAAETLAPAGDGSDAQSVRRAWDEIVRMVGQSSKKAAAFAREAVVRDIDGQTLVLVFKHRIHADGVSNEPGPLLAAVNQVLGGAWSLRTEVGGDQRSANVSAGSPGIPSNDDRPEPDRSASAGSTPSRSASPGPQATGSAAARPAAARSTATGSGTSRSASAGSAVARSAAAGSASSGSAAARSAAARSTAARSGSGGAKSSPSSSGEPAPRDEEVPYDPEFDGPAPARAAREGFDPGDEPDPEADSLAVRQTSEEQALDSLRTTFKVVEKIAENR